MTIAFSIARGRCHVQISTTEDAEDAEITERGEIRAGDSIACSRQFSVSSVVIKSAGSTSRGELSMLHLCKPQRPPAVRRALGPDYGAEQPREVGASDGQRAAQVGACSGTAAQDHDSREAGV